MSTLKWHYTNDIHNYITIGDEEFRLNTAYDNVMILLRAFQDKTLKNKLDAFFRIIIFKTDHERFKMATKYWTGSEFGDLADHISKNVLHFKQGDKSKRYYDIDMDAELIYASFYKDYKISLVEKKGKMKWVEFIILLENLSSNTALGRVIKIMKSKPKDLSPEENKIRVERTRLLNQDNDLQSQIDGLVGFLMKTAKVKADVKQESK
jgi:hypothetical protein